MKKMMQKQKNFQRKKFKESFYSSSRNLNKKNISLASCLFTPFEHVSCHMIHCKESHWMKKKVFQNDPRRFKKKMLDFFFEPFRSVLFRAREQVNRSRVKEILRI